MNTFAFSCGVVSATRCQAQAPRFPDGLLRPIRLATFNISLYGATKGDVEERIASGEDSQAKHLAEIIQRIRPHILLLNEIDYDAEQRVLNTFVEKYLQSPQNVSNDPDGPAEAISFGHRFVAPSNTGIHSGRDLDRNGVVNDKPGADEYGGDCWGFGAYPGQYAMALLSQYPIDATNVRTFQTFRWRDMPASLLPDALNTSAERDWYAPETLAEFPLSSKSHWDVPIRIDGRTVHILASHPTPPTYDGPEDRNGRRNHDETRFWVDYVDPHQGEESVEKSYIYDDDGRRGGLPANEPFVILGDLNGDPYDGEGRVGIVRLLKSPRLLEFPPPSSPGGREQSHLQKGANLRHLGKPENDTCDPADNPGPGNLRLDYVLPSTEFRVVESGVFWPTTEDPLFPLVGTFPFPSSDHRLVWVDVVFARGDEKGAD